MRRLASGLLCVGALVASGVLVAPAAAKTTACGSYKTVTSTETGKYTQIKAVDVTCTKAHKVLMAWAHETAGGTALGFTCAALPEAGHPFQCIDGAKSITGHVTYKY